MSVTCLFPRRWAGTALVLVAVCLLSGCGKKFGSVTGTVSYKGKNLNGGQVAFLPEAPGAEPATSIIDPDGKYTIAKVLVGPSKVTVTTPVEMKVLGAGGRMMDASAMGGKEGKSKVAAGPETKMTKVPDKFGQPESSGLSFDVKLGPNSHDIKLTD